MPISKAAVVRKLILAAASIAFTASMMPLATPTEARTIQWCARTSQGTSCMYHTQEQCRASVSGRGGSCVRRRV